MRVITFGTFDLFHIGHLNILQRAKKEGDYLIVGVSSDMLNIKKGKKSIFNQYERLKIIQNIKCVDEVFLEESLDEKDNYIKKYKADLLIMGDDWTGKFNWVSSPVKYLPRTENISTTIIRDIIANNII